jgi:hypothetical protein
MLMSKINEKKLEGKGRVFQENGNHVLSFFGVVRDRKGYICAVFLIFTRRHV